MSDRATPSNQQQLNFAVFGDIHGRIALMYTLAILWQQQSGIELDGLLQVGDLGAFPDLSKLDKATQKHSQKDSDELGFQNFYVATPESQFYLQHSQAPKTYFVRGNHEDFEYLGEFTKPTPIDPWQQIWFIPDNQAIEIRLADRLVKIGAFGGIAPRQECAARGKLAREKYRKAQKISNSEPRFFSETDIANISLDLQNLDILMTHAGPQSPELPTGSIFLDRLITHLQPKVHLFGHHHQVIYRQDPVSNLLSIGLAHLEFDNGKLKPSSWGILSISPESLSFVFMSPDLFPILDRITRTNYRSLI
ncbi:metallophosphoesterase family protein [Chamaesiphon sp. VAR_48_metabat_403]|uniref:metallophosphoesterase family protein n=1 Tax=Chamaesiphon sp. VAR_48_metabat_403 TaxID=2964700 RepID=UPI00286E1F46|nr:metallophosphoesterase family protein [Chamaesiphon sp. VAR_48_metabat_403]